MRNEDGRILLSDWCRSQRWW